MATPATCCSSFRPNRLPISASAVRSRRDSRRLGCRWAFRMRFSANRYSFFRRSSWLTRPVTKARKRATLEMFGFKLYRSKPRPISAFEYFGYTGLAKVGQWINCQRWPMFKVAFGGILSAVSLLNLLFGWFRAFDWLQNNAPTIWGFLVNPVTQYTLIISGLVLSATGLRVIWQNKHRASVSGPQKTYAGSRATATESSTVIGSMENLQAGGDIFIGGGNKTIADYRPPKPAIDVSLTCTAAINPLEIMSGSTAYVVSLNQGVLRSRGFYSNRQQKG